MLRNLTRFGLIVVVMLTGALRVHAQVCGATVSGIIAGAQGGALAGIKISARNLGTGLATETATNSAGAYAIPNLIPGDYQVTVSAAGFSTAVTKLTLTVGQK